MRTPRLLPLVGVAVGGVLAVKALTGVAQLPDLVQGAKAFAEGIAPAKTQDAGKLPASSAKLDPNAPVLPPGLSPSAPTASAAVVAANQQKQAAGTKLVCPTSPTELAREAGLSPAELQVLQSLGARRGQLDQREQDMDVQVQLLNAAEAKLDAKLQALASMKAELQKLLSDGDAKKATEIDNLVTVYSKMRPRDAAQRMSVLDDSVRLPIAAKMKPAALSAILGQMAPADAKDITEKLAGRFEPKAVADARQAVSGQPQAANGAAQPAAKTPPPAPAAQAANASPEASAETPPKPVKVAARPKRRRKPAAQLAENLVTAPVKPTSAASPPTSAPASPAAAPTAAKPAADKPAAATAPAPAASTSAPAASTPAAAKTG